MVRRRILAVLGPGEAREHELALAEEVGRRAARAGWVVLTGGGDGVMAAASRGAVEAGGITVGVLPVARPGGAYPNPWVAIPVFTGAGMARNAVNVLSATLCVAIGGGAGTLSEIAMALKAGVELWSCGSWRLEPPAETVVAAPRVLDDPRALLEALDERLAAGDDPV